MEGYRLKASSNVLVFCVLSNSAHFRGLETNQLSYIES